MGITVYAPRIGVLVRVSLAFWVHRGVDSQRGIIFGMPDVV